MKAKIIYFSYVCVLFGLAIFFGFLLRKDLLNENNIFSPLPNFLTIFMNNQVSTLSIWSPSSDVFMSPMSYQFPKVSAKSVLLYNLKKDKILFSKNPDKKLPMASLTKIMTAIVAIEASKEKQIYTVKPENLVGENAMGLSSSEKLNLEELIYGLILSSGNDAAETLASNYPQGRAKFIEAMNNKAKALGLKNTNFTNPSGLEGDGNQYTTTFDLLVMTRYALQLPLFKKIVGTFRYNIPYSENHKSFYLENETNLISSYPGVQGVKDGYTPEAGLCLVTYLNYKDNQIIGILLGSDNRRQEMKDLLDYGLKIQSVVPPKHG